MLLRRSKLAAGVTERPILAPHWLIALLAAMVAFALFLLYPRQDLERRIADMPESSLSAAYLDNLLRSDPGDPQLRLQLARRQVQLGETEKARNTLQPALEAGDPGIRREAHWLLWELTAADLRRLPDEPSPRRNQLRDELRRQLRELASEPWPGNRMVALAGMASQLNETALATELYQKAVKSIGESKTAAELFEHAARQALANGDYRGCAELYILARNATADPATARRYFHSALKALQSGNQPLAALELGERELGPLADDPETLYLMINLARASGRPDVADRHVRRLLRLSLMQQLQSQQIARAWGEGAFRRVSQQTGEREPGIEFDNKAYTLGYEVFVENGKLEDAWVVAKSAVRQAPEDLVWCERLARVSEWTGRPQVALFYWLKVAKASQKDEAWQGVLRLAPGLFDDAALIPALQYQLARQAGDLRLARELVAAYERLGDPQPAIAYLERATRQNPRPELLEMLAELAERAGQPDTALHAWKRLFADPRQITSRRALRVAILLLQQGRGAEGLKWLERAQAAGAPLASENDVEYWRLTGQLAEIQQKDEQAIRSFRRLVDTERAEAGDYDALIRLLSDTHPLEAAQLATQAWQRYDEPRHLVKALTLYWERNRWEEIGALFRQLEPAAEATRRSLRRLQQLPEFLRLAGAYQQSIGQFDAARRSLEASLRLAPDSPDTQQALLWLLIDGNDAVALRKLLGLHELEWRQNPGLHDVLAAAYQALSRPQVALERYLTPRIASHQHDFLWLMNYADALEQNQQSDRAWRLRRQLLFREWQAVQGKGQSSLSDTRSRWLTEDGLELTRRVARTRLLVTQKPGDAGFDALRELLRVDRDARGNFSNAAADTAIAWLQDSGQYTAVRGFLWQQYSRTLSKRANRPLWAEISATLAEDDKAETGQLLSTFDESLPRYDRVNAARAVDDLRLAQTAAFETQSDQIEDDQTHKQLTETLLAFSDHAGFAAGWRRIDGLDETATGLNYHYAIDPRLSFDLQWGNVQRRATDESIIRNVPNEQLFGAKLNWRHPNGETSFMVQQIDSFALYTPLLLEHEQRIDNRLSLRFGLGTQLPARDTVPLQVAGMQDLASISLRYRPTRMDEIVMAYWRDRYQLQTGGKLGDGQHVALTAAHAYRQETRDLEFSAFWSNHQYFNREYDLGGFDRQDLKIVRLLPEGFTPGPDYFLPANFSFYGVRVSTDVRYQREYTRALRPFGSVAGTYHTSFGAGYDVFLGIAGSIFGTDHFALSGGISQSGLQTGGLVKGLAFTYRIHF